MRDTQVSILPDILISCSLFKNLLEYLRRKCCGQEEKSEQDMLFEIVTQLQNVTFCDNRKIAFIAEKLSLVYVKPNGRLYSSSLLAMAYM